MLKSARPDVPKARAFMASDLDHPKPGDDAAFAARHADISVTTDCEA
jgi:hypothetical protein